MLRTRLLTATAAMALFAAGSAFAQTGPIPTPSGSAQTTTGQSVLAPAAPDSTPPAAGDAPDTPAAMQAPEATAPATPAAPAQTAATQNTVIDVLRANGQFTTLLGALDAAQLTDTLKTQPAISIFAPTDAAFAALPEADRARLMDPANVNELRQVLLYHVVVADVESSQIEGAKGGVQTAATTEVQLDGTGDAIKVDNATVTTADVDAGNGSIFIIDRVLNPAQSLVASGDAEEAAAPADAAETATPPADDTVEAPPPVDGSMDDDSSTADTMDADSATDEGAVAPPPTTPAAPAPAAAAPTAPVTTPAPAPSSTTTTTTAPAPAPAGLNAPNGQPAATTTTTASPTVPNPTDGQVDDEDEEETDEAPAPTPTPQA
jgi:uncharacterized surface protein with fasciclin (FAS1) repeats